MATRRAKTRRPRGEDELARLLTRLSQPGLERWEADTAKVRHLLSLDAAAVMKRLEQKQDEAVSLFSRLRTREPLIELCRSRFVTTGFAELVRLSAKEQQAICAFHDVLGELRWYVSYTEDMPSTVRTTVSQLARRLDELHHRVRATLGPPEGEGHPVIDAGPA